MAWACAHQRFAWLFSHAANYQRSHDHFPFMRPPSSDCQRQPRASPSTPSIIDKVWPFASYIMHWEAVAPPDRTIRPLGTTPSLIPYDDLGSV
jgi:hypothetical protein